MTLELLLLSVSLYLAASAPADTSIAFPGGGRRDRNAAPTPPEAVAFMRRFGYLESASGPDSEALYTAEAVKEAIRQVQRFGAIPQTGELDEKTTELLKSPRCGNPDLETPAVVKKRRRKRFVIGSQGWNKRTVRYYLANWSPKLANETVVLSALSRAFSAWSEYSRLVFRRTGRREKADIVVAFGRYSHGDSYPFDGPGYVLAHAYYPYDYDNGLGGDVHFDEDEDWKPDGFSGGTDFFTVAVHELGHALGLSHSPDQESVMFPYYKGAATPGKEFHIGYDDILAMYELYVQRPLQEDGHIIDQDDILENDQTTTTSIRPTKPKITTTTTIRTPSFDDYQADAPVKDDDDYIVDVNPSDLCQSPDFDELAHLRGELFAFKGTQMWRFSSRGVLRQGYPARFDRMFGDFGLDVAKIDAAYERAGGDIVFFSGRRFWVFDGYGFSTRGAPLTDLGLPNSLGKVDAAFRWGKNGKEYVFAGERYWRLEDGKVENGYPLPIADRWRGLPDDLDSAFTWKSGITYFFKANLFWRFDDAGVQAEFHHATPVSKFWLGCSS